MEAPQPLVLVLDAPVVHPDWDEHKERMCIVVWIVGKQNCYRSGAHCGVCIREKTAALLGSQPCTRSAGAIGMERLQLSYLPLHSLRYFQDNIVHLQGGNTEFRIFIFFS